MAAAAAAATTTTAPSSGATTTGPASAAHPAAGKELREIGHEAVWSLSTAKPGNGACACVSVCAFPCPFRTCCC